MNTSAKSKKFLVLASLFALLATLLSAFVTHLLKMTLTPYQLSIFQTGIFYQFIYSLALFGVGLLLMHLNQKWITLTGYLFTYGILLFSGSLYAISIYHIKWIGILTPLGGLAFIFGWLFLIIGLFKSDWTTHDTLSE